MESVKEIHENPLPETSAPDALSLYDNHSHIDSCTNRKVDSDSQQPCVDGATVHLGDSSHSPLLANEVDGRSPSSESSVSMSVLAIETSKISEAGASGILLSAKDKESLDLQKDESSTDLSESSASFLSETGPTDTTQEPLDRSPINSCAQTNDISNGHAVDTVGSLASEDSKHGTPLSQMVDGLGITHSHDSLTSVPSPHVGDNVASKNAAQPALRITRIAVGAQSSVDSRKSTGKLDVNWGQIDTAAPIESVKQAVSKFGGVVDWKAHRVQTVEKRKVIEQELEKAESEIPSYKKQCEAAEDAKVQVLNELDNTKRLIEELKLSLERVQTEERQAKQDAELAVLRVEEMEQGIADEASVAAKAQLEVTKGRHAAAISELKAVKDELEALREDYALLVIEEDALVKIAEEAVSASKEAEKTVEDLTNELIIAKESLESAHAAHLEVEEHRLGAAMAREQDTLQWEKEVKQAEEELEILSHKILLAKDLKSKLDTASSLLKDLKAEFATYMESKLKEDADEDNLNSSLAESGKRTHSGMQAAVASAQKELEEVKLNIEKAMSEVDCLKVAAASLKSELEKEKAELATTRQREGMASIAVSSLEAELDRVKSEIAVVQLKVKEARDKMEDLPKRLPEAAQEADQSKLRAQEAREELRKAKEEAEEAKAGASTIRSKLLAAQKEIEAAKASEKLALAVINGLQESESAQSINDKDSLIGVTLTLEEYYKLSKQAHDAEDAANNRVVTAMSQIELAKESQVRNLNKLKELSREMAERKAALQVALGKAEKAKEGKLGIEQELRKWRAEHQQRRKASESVPVVDPSKTTRRTVEEKKEPKNLDSAPDCAVEHQGVNPMENSHGNKTEAESSPVVKVTKKKKKSFFQRIFMFLAKKKSRAKSA